MAVVTSGTYEKFFEINDKKYSDIIDPRTGYPATGTKSVTIVCPDAELADALATAVFILGEKEGIAVYLSMKRTSSGLQRS
ncbi:FAD:protein FMN transferase [candidate division KSB1 bacterium]|nr:FAD:protein FMN transferase [candidate division KSB1 bacterium]